MINSKEFGDVGKFYLVRCCGYVSSKGDGDQRLNFTAMLYRQPGDKFEIKLGHKQMRPEPEAVEDA
jgi:hypothetical protein